MPTKKQNTEPRDKVLMALCRKAARKRGLDPDEPSFKAYCTRLYNQTMQGSGLSDFASDRDATEAANRLNKIFRKIDFPYEITTDGQFLDFRKRGESRLLDPDDVAIAFRKFYGTGVNFDKLTSQFWSSDPATRAFVEKYSDDTTPDVTPEPPKKTPDVEPEPEPRDSDSQKGETGVLGGLKYRVLDESEYKAWVNVCGNQFTRYKVASMNNISGSHLRTEFGVPTLIGWSEDKKTYSTWMIQIADLGYFQIYDYNAFKPSKNSSKIKRIVEDNAASRNNKKWSLGFCICGPFRNMTEQECDHAMHFFGDSFFDGTVMLWLQQCLDNAKKQPLPPIPEQSPDKEPTDPEAKPKRGKGRPPGSKNKPKAEKEEKPKRGKGRPPGSKNKPKSPTPEPAETPKREGNQPSAFIKAVGYDIFFMLQRNEEDALQKVYDWFADLPESVDLSALITDAEMKTLLDLMMKD